MIQEYIERGPHGGLTYVRKAHDVACYRPIYWESLEAFIADLEQAAKDAFGLPLAEVRTLSGRKNASKLQAAFEAILLRRFGRKDRGQHDY
jgi:hypothetical protein